MDDHTLLGVIGGVVSAAVAGVVAWGRLRRVDVTRVGSWLGAPTIAVADLEDLAVVVQAARWLRELGWPIGRVSAGGAGDIRVVPWNPARFNGDDPRGWTGLDFYPGTTRIRSATVMLRERSKVAAVHELLHAMGCDHPPWCPTGHPLHPRRPGLRDTRGLRG